MAGVTLLLALATAAVYAPVLQHGFIELDDRLYVTENAHVPAGLTLQNLRWAFTTFEVGNWHPLTWLSHMVDAELFGLVPWGHHLTSLLLHVANTGLLFALLWSLTGALGPSAFAAALFGLHPLHVESVAWVSERKDVLSTLFWLLATASYVRWVRAPRGATPRGTALLLALGLLAKPMLVTLPFTLLLLDHWPLARAAGLAARLREKLPLFLLAAASAAVTVVAQAESRFVAPLTHPLDARVAHALVSYVVYLGKLVWPVDLAVFYPHPGSHPAGHVLGAVLLLTGISLAAWRLRARQPALLVGWLWYLGTLAPVIGLVQVGSQGLADRYTYVPSIGIFAGVAWTVPWLAARLPRRLPLLAALAAALLLASAYATRVQLAHWQTSIGLFQHSLRVTGSNAIAERALANSFYTAGRYRESLAHYEAAVRLDPADPYAANDLGAALAHEDRRREALPYFRQAARHAPDWITPRYNLALSLLELGDGAGALEALRAVLRLEPSHAQARTRLGILLARLGRSDQALEELGRAAAQPGLDAADEVAARNALGSVLATQGRTAEAIEQLERALRRAPDHPELHFNLGNARLEAGEPEAAIGHLTRALELDPGHARARAQLARARAAARRAPESR